jgi:N-dimethylarginine dimethylaminohydrolase
MDPPQPRSSTTERIHVNVRSEIDTLKTVVMCWANPFRTNLGMVTSVFSSSVRKQLRHNTWKTYSYERVREQQQRVAQVLRDHGVVVLFVDNVSGINSQHYTRDIAFCIDDAFFVARMGTRYREPEQRALAILLPRLSKVVRLERGRIEGGDVMLYNDKVLVGLGEATDAEGVDELRLRLVELGNPREVVPIPVANRGVIHLDTKFNIVGKNVALFSRKTFQPDTIRWFERHFDLIDATDNETRALEINTFAIGGGRVIMQERSERLAKLVQHRGMTPIQVDYSEVTRWPGSFRCTTLPVERAA